MGKLILDEADGNTREIPLDKPRVTIGRHPDNDICLADLAVSGRHSVVLCDGQDALIEDLQSTNGTLVNGRAITRATLLPGDNIAIGRNRMVYASQDWSPAEASTGEPVAVAEAVGSTLQRLPAGKLRIDSGPGIGREMELNKPLTTVGKPGQLVVAITRRFDGYFVADAGGPLINPKPKLNGKEIGYTARKLANSDQIEVAGTRMTFVLI